jgi:hypothetical protein
MSRKSIFLGVILITVLSSMSFAGSGSHGGGTIVCRNEQGKIISAELLDLWEGKKVRNLDILEEVESDADIPDLIRRAVRILNEKGQIKMAKTVELVANGELGVVNASLSFVSEGVGIAAPSDANAVFIPKGNCRIEGVGAYNDRYLTFFIDKELYSELSALNRAALFVHEGVYKYLRDTFHVEDSITARGITACLFSKLPCPELDVKDGIPETGFLMQCHNEIPYLKNKTEPQKAYMEYFLFVSKENPHTMRIQFTRLGVDTLPTKSFIDRNFDRLPEFFKGVPEFALIHNPPLWIKSSVIIQRDFAIALSIGETSAWRCKKLRLDMP